jgi:PAS domain S-box-containing protein
MMPVVDGFELLRQIRAEERTRTLPVIMLSARAGEEVRIEGLQAGADDYLVKPFTARELTARVRSHIAMARSRREAEVTVRAAQERLRLALDASSLGAWELDPRTGTLQANARYKDLFGFPPDAEPTLAMAVERFHPEDRKRMEAAVAQLLRADREQEYGWNFRVLLPDGTVRWIAANGKALRTNAATDAGFRLVGTVRDVTEQRQSEESMRETQKLESMGLLAGGIAHDFNNLLTGVIGNVSLLADQIPPESPLSETVEALSAAGERMSRLTSQMLAYSGRGHFVIETVDLSKQVVQITTLVQASIPKNVQLRLCLSNDLPLIDADISQLQQVIMNLVINAAEAVGSEPGMVELTTGVEAVGKDFRGNLTREEPRAGDYVVMTVTDTGCGMDEATCARIFDPFFTTKFTGRGLGLSSVLGIVRSHKGLLTLDSIVGGGTKFRVFFPIAERRAQARPAPDGSAPGEGTVLVVDDEEIVRRMAQAALKRLGYRVLTANNGEEAVRLYSRAPDEVDLVLLDMTMPVMGGEEALRIMKQIRPGVTVVGMSGFDEQEAHSRFGRGIAGFVQKPFTAGRLGAAIRAARSTPPATPTE